MWLLDPFRGRGIRSRFLHLFMPKYWPFHPRYRIPLETPLLIFIAAMPRTGSTLVKRYFGDSEGFTFETETETGPVASALQGIRIEIRKNTVLMPQVWAQFREYGNQAWYVGVVRDPRDQLLSLLETDRHPEIPRDKEFWQLWMRRYADYFRFAARHSEMGTNAALVRYEDLVRDPVGVKARFLSWVGADAAVAPTPEYHNTVGAIARGVDTSEDWKTHQHNRVHEGSLARWRKVVDLTIADAIVGYRSYPEVQAFMEQLGYGDDLGGITLSLPGIEILR